MKTTEVKKEFLPVACAARSDAIIEACGEMSVDMYRIFIMWYVDRLDIDQIAFAMQMQVSELKHQIREGQAAIIVALKEEMRDEDVDWEERASLAEGPIVAKALDVFVNRIFPAESTKDIVSRAVKEAVLRKKSPDRSRAGGRIASGKSGTGRTVRTAAPVAATQERSLRGRGFFSGLAASVAAFFVTIKSSTPVQAATVAALGVIAIGSGVILYNSAPTPEDANPPANPPAYVVEPGRLPSPVVTPPVLTPPLQSNQGPAVQSPSSTDHSPDTVTYPPSDIELPTFYPPGTPEEAAAYQLQLAYVKAVREGEIVLYDADCNCGHVNPKSARVKNMEPGKGTIKWAVRKSDQFTVLFQGDGEEVGDALVQLRQNYGAGTYHIDFTYTVSDGLSVTKTRPIHIDTGMITENQYE